MTIESTLLHINDLERSIREYFNWEIDLDKFVDFVDSYWVEHEDYIWIADNRNEFKKAIVCSSLLVFPILHKQYSRKDNFVAIKSCRVIMDNTKEKLIAYPECVEYIILDNNKKLNFDMTRFENALELEFCR